MAKEVKKVLILEDDKERIRKFKSMFSELFCKTEIYYDIDFVETPEDCMSKLKENKYNFICLDHDLFGKVFVNPEEKCTGSEVARWLSANSDNINNRSKIFLHSLHDEGAAYMNKLLPLAIRKPLLWESSIFNEISW